MWADFCELDLESECVLFTFLVVY